MADKTTKVAVTISAETGDAGKKVGDLKKGVDGLGQSAEKSAKTATGAFGSIGNSLKSLGIISAVVKGFDFFKETLMKNQKVADAFSVAMNFLTGIFSDFVSFLVDNTGNVVKFFKDVFENPTVYIDKLATAIKDNLIERVKSVIDAFGFLGDVIKNVFTGKFDEASEAAKNFGKELVDVVTGVDDSVDKTTKAVGELIDVSADYFNKKIDQAKALTNATNNAILAEARMLNTIKQTEIAAEKLRQKRDDETISIQERIAANEQLSEVLKKGQAQELALVGIRENKIRAEIALNGQNKDLQAELIRLQGERTDIEEKYTAFASEQLVNANGLAKEKLALDQAIAASQNKLLIERKKANAELIKDEIDKLNESKKIAEEESQIELKRLTDNINNTKAGTQARVDAEIAYAEKKQQIDLSLQTLDNQIAVATYKREIELLDRVQTERDIVFQVRVDALDQEQILVQEAFDKKLITETEYNQKVKSLTDQRIAYQDAELQAKLQFANAIGGVLSGLSGLFAQGTAAAKVAALAEIAIGTGVGFINALDIAQKGAKATGPAAPFAFPIFYATQIAAVLGAASKAKNILTQVKGGGSSGPITSLSAPTVNAQPPLVPRTQTTRIDQDQINQIGNVAARAYVVESDVTSAQERANRLNRAATIQ